VLEGGVHGEKKNARGRGRASVSVKGKNRKSGGAGKEAEGSRAEPEQNQEAGMSDEIVREFLVESPVESEPAGEQPGGSEPGGGGDEFCPGANSESGDVECDGEGVELADAIGLLEVERAERFFRAGKSRQFVL
jgi:hypothetical protein